METEIKLRLPRSLAAIRRKLRADGFRIAAPRALETNIIFDDANLSLGKQGRLIRVRRHRGQFLLTYKGPAQPGRHKRRPEIELLVPDADRMEQILRGIGFRPVFRYEKYRTEFAQGRGSGEVLLDQTPIGNFLELEGPARWIDRTARRLGFRASDYIVDSYGHLYLEYCREHGIPPRDMLFGDMSIPAAHA